MKINSKKGKTNYLNQKGITLIALVVTIVVLLILAGVSINVLFSDSGIIKRAKDSQNKWKEAEQNDLDSLSTLEDQIDMWTEGKIVAKEGTLLAMYQKAVEDKCTNSDGTCTNAEHLHIGDYVDYKNPTSGTVEVKSAESGIYGEDSNGNATVNITQTYTLSETKNNVKWRVLGIDSKTGGIKLISADPIERDANADLLTALGSTKEDPYLYLKGAESYLYGPDAMDKIGKMYLNSYATEARSVKMEDVNKITGITTVEKIKEVNAAAYNGNKQYGEKYSCSGQYTPELWLQIGKEADSTKAITVSGTVNGYWYSINSKIEEGAPSVTMTNTRAYDMMFKDIEEKAYWLASCGVFADSDHAFFGLGVVSTLGSVTAVGIGSYSFESDSFGNRENRGGMAVRPVVVLKSGVKKEEVPKIADQASTWTYVVVK